VHGYTTDKQSMKEEQEKRCVHGYTTDKQSMREEQEKRCVHGYTTGKQSEDKEHLVVRYFGVDRLLRRGR
jgi:Tat protein secretion system quality control protein TatD with DNase activity